MTSPMGGFRIATGFLEIKAQVDQAQRDVEKFLRKEETDLGESGKRSGKKFGDGLLSGLLPSFDKLGRRMLDLVKGITRGLWTLTKWGSIAFAVAAAIGAIAGAIVKLLPLITDLAQTATAAAGSLLLIPAGVVAIVGIVSALKVGLGGVGAAFKQASAGGKSYIDTMRQARDAANQLVDANMAVEEAEFALVDAQKAFLRAQRGRNEDNIARADLALRQARQRLKEAKERASDLEQDKGKPAGGGGGNDALAKLAPNAREFVRQIQALKPAFEALQMRVQNALFAGLGQSISLLARTHLPALSGWLTGIANSLNTNFRAALAELSTDAAKASWSLTFRDTGTAIDNVLKALKPLMSMLTNISEVGSKVLADITGGVGPAFDRLAARVEQMAKSGELEQMIRGGLDALRTLGGGLADVWGIIKGIFSAAEVAGGGGLFKALDEINTIINSESGQSNMAAVFGALSSAATSMAPAFSALLGALVPVSAALAQVATVAGPVFAQVFEALGPALAALAPGLSALGGPLVAASKALAPLATILSDLLVGFGPGLQTFIEAIASGLESLAPVAKPVGEALGAVLGAISPLIAVIAPIAAQLLKMIADALLQLAPALVPLVQQIAALIGYLMPVLIPVLQFLISLLVESLKMAIDGVVRVIRGLITYVKGVVDVFIGIFTGNWSRAWEGIKKMFFGGLDLLIGAIELFLTVTIFGKIKTGVMGIKGFFKGAWDDAVAWLKGLPGRIGEFFKGVDTWLLDAGKKLMQGLIDGVKLMADPFKKAGETIANGFRSLWPFSPAKEGPLSGAGDLLYAGRNTIGRITKGMIDATPSLIATANRVASMLATPIQTVATSSATAAPAAAGGPGYFGPYEMNFDGRQLGAFIIDAVTGAPQQVAAAANEGNRRIGGFSNTGRRR